MPQEQQHAQVGETQSVDEQTQAGVEASAGVADQALDQIDALDAVLDDIESTLETNAEEYVSSFVQKGGQ